MTEPSPALTSPALAGLVLDHLTEGVMVVDRQLNVLLFNRGAERLTGQGRQEVVGHRCQDVLRTPLCQDGCPLRRCLATGAPSSPFANEIATRGGSRSVHACVTPLFDERGQLVGGLETFWEALADRQGLTLAADYVYQGIVSQDAQLRRLFAALPEIARSAAPVLVLGSSGTGKELVALAIHQLGPRAQGPLIKVSCAGLPEEQLAAELFGGGGQRSGRLQDAQGGTLLLDEVGELPLLLQAKLLAALRAVDAAESGTRPARASSAAGAAKQGPLPRLLAITRQELELLVAAGRFREDLYYHLNVVRLRLPELRERRGDVPLLVRHIVSCLNQRLGRQIVGVTDEALALLERYPYPGNVRELANLLEHAYVITRGPLITAEDLPAYLVQGRCFEPLSSGWTPLPSAAGRYLSSPEQERRRTIECLHRNYWSIPRAARELGMHRTTLWRRLKRLGISREGLEQA